IDGRIYRVDRNRNSGGDVSFLVEMHCRGPDRVLPDHVGRVPEMQMVSLPCGVARGGLLEAERIRSTFPKHRQAGRSRVRSIEQSRSEEPPRAAEADWICW